MATSTGSNSDHNEIVNDLNTEVNIAIVGKTGSGRFSFVKAVTGNEENQKGSTTRKPAETRTKCKWEPISYSHPGNSNVKFSILPNLDKAAFPAFKPYLEYAENYEFDAFLIFTTENFDKRHLLFAKRLTEKKKPFFFIRSKIDCHRHSDRYNEHDDFYKHIRAGLANKLKDNECRECEIYLVSNHHLEKWDMERLINAIAVSLPSPKDECFRNMIASIQDFIVKQRFKNFIEERQQEETSITEPIISFDEIKQLFMGSGIAGLQRTITKNLEHWKEVKINLAILGNSGAGKSSFLNAIRGLDDDDEFAARTGVTETTNVPTSYRHPTNPNILFWDLPGIGTPEYPDLQTFCEKVVVEMYDTFLIICSQRFTNFDFQLADKVQTMGKSFFFIRTKIDNDVRSEKRKKAFDEGKMLERIRNDCQQNLLKSDFGELEIFLISSHHRTKWDFNRLEKAVLDQLPSKQKESLTMTLRSHSKHLLSEKIKLLKGRIRYVALVSVATKFSFGPFSLFLDTKLIRSVVQFYCSQLAFPESNSNEFKKLPKDLQRKVKKFRIKSDDEYLQWLKLFDPEDTYKIRMKMKMTITSKPLHFVHWFLNMILDEMEQTALAILEVNAFANDEEENEGEVNAADEELNAEDGEVNAEDGEVNAEDGEVNTKDGEGHGES